MKQLEIRRNKGKKTKKLRKKRPKIQEKQPQFCGCLLGPFLTIKLGIFKDVCLFGAHQSSEVTLAKRKVCGNSAENSRKFLQKVLIASGKGAEILQKVAEISRNFAENFLQ